MFILLIYHICLYYSFIIYVYVAHLSYMPILLIHHICLYDSFIIYVYITTFYLLYYYLGIGFSHFE